jgi:hypothetical protein
MEKDSNGNDYIEIEMSNHGKIRITYIIESWYETPALRVQIRESDGHLKQGPEIPIEFLGETVASMINLMSNKANE